IANSLAAKLYGLTVLERSIESNKKNYTRFLILTDKHIEIKNPNKASICFQVSNEAGALVKVLNILAELNINMSKVQSMPVLGRRNEYNFYVDIEWEGANNFDDAINRMVKHTINFSIMGEYVKNDAV